MCNSTRTMACILTLGITMFGAGGARAQTPLSANTAPYRHAYTQSQSIFDQCGDGVRGELYRRVLTEKMKSCPFSAAEKAEFQAVSQSARIAEEDRQAHAAGPVPAAADETLCKQSAAVAEMRLVPRRLDQFGQGRIGADGVIEEACMAMQP